MYDRSKTVGASDAVHIQAGQWAELFDRKQSPEPSEYPLAAELGHRLEPFNIELFEDDTGREVFIDDNWGSKPLHLAGYQWCTYIPDGLLKQEDDDDISIFGNDPDDEEDWFIPIECKCINMMWKPYNLLNKYMPQLQHAMRVTNSPYCIFSVIYLNTRYEWNKVEYDPAYDDALFKKEKLFHWFLKQGQRPPQYLGKRRGWV